MCKGVQRGFCCVSTALLCGVPNPPMPCGTEGAQTVLPEACPSVNTLGGFTSPLLGLGQPAPPWIRGGLRADAPGGKWYLLCFRLSDARAHMVVTLTLMSPLVCCSCTFPAPRGSKRELKPTSLRLFRGVGYVRAPSLYPIPTPYGSRVMYVHNPKPYTVYGLHRSKTNQEGPLSSPPLSVIRLSLGSGCVPGVIPFFVQSFAAQQSRVEP
jgi:hypothetical protein